MIIYKSMFKNIRVPETHPIEDSYYGEGNIFVVADGVTRDPLAPKKFKDLSIPEFLKYYPNPSGAAIASEEIVKIVEKNKDEIIKQTKTLKEVLIEANERIKEINNEKVPRCDYLTNDYYGAVTACGYINQSILHYAFICDCGLSVYAKHGELKFKTTQTLADQLGVKIENFDWKKDEDRSMFRRTYRNNKAISPSFGVLTGEETAIPYIEEGKIELETGDIVLCYTDGFTDYLEREDFIEQLKDFDKVKFEQYLDKVSKEDKKYGSERTLIYYKN